tara:strand:- start:495 stop:605 length:111 start_codon:yes stop_codon:yes gene_type:complete
MRTAVAVITMISGKLWFFLEAMAIVLLIKVIKGFVK